MTAWLAIFACWMVSFLFAGIEAGLLAVDPVRLRAQAKHGQHAALRLERLLNHPERLLVTVLLVTNMADILALILLTRRLVRTFGNGGFFIALLVALPIYIFVLGVLPKSLFRRFPVSRAPDPGRLAPNCLDAALAGPGIGEPVWPALPPKKKIRTRTFVCGARRIETDHDAKRTGRFAHHDGARHDSQRRRFHDGEGARCHGAASQNGHDRTKHARRKNSAAQRKHANRSTACRFKKRRSDRSRQCLRYFVRSDSIARREIHSPHRDRARGRARVSSHSAIARRAARSCGGRQCTKKTDRHRDVGRIDQAARFSRTGSGGKQRTGTFVVASSAELARRNSSLKIGNAPAADLSALC